MNPENQPRSATKDTAIKTPELSSGSSYVTSLSKGNNLPSGYAPSVGFISLDSDPKLLFRFRHPKNFKGRNEFDFTHKYDETRKHQNDCRHKFNSGKQNSEKAKRHQNDSRHRFHSQHLKYETTKHQNVLRGASSRRPSSSSRNHSQNYVMGLMHGITTANRKEKKHYPSVRSPKKLRVSTEIIEPSHQPKPTEIPPVPTCSLVETVPKGSNEPNPKTDTRTEENALREEKPSTRDPRLAKLRVRQDLMASDESTKQRLNSSLYLIKKNEVEYDVTQSVVDFVKTETFFEEDPMPVIKQEQYWF